MNGSTAHTETLNVFARFIRRSIGLHFTRERLPELSQKMSRVATEAGCAELDHYLLRLMSEPLTGDRLDMLVTTLTIGETYFLRDPKSYQVLSGHILPELIRARRRSGKRLRIWSAGCSTGEEPYTIAILLSRALPDLQDWEITLLGTDINREALERARRGVYSQWSFRNAPPWMMEYFSKRGDGRYEISPAIRDMVRFRELNLARDGEATAEEISGMDVIFCRNVMLYFAGRETACAMSRFHAALRDNGSLFVAPAEVNNSLIDGFVVEQYDGALVLRKSAAGTAMAGREATWEPRQMMTAPEQSGREFSSRRGLQRAEDSAVSVEAASAGMSRVMPQGNEAPASTAPRAAEETSTMAGTATGPQGSGKIAAAATVGVPGVATVPPPPQAASTAGAGAAGASEDAATLYRAGQYLRAAEAALDLDAEQGQQAEALALAARSYANTGDLQRARACCEQAIACDRLSASNHYLLSIILEQQGDKAAAVKSLRNALFIDDDYLVAYLALANLHLSSGDPKEAGRNFSNALRLLEKRPADEVLPEAEGMSAGALARAIRGMGKALEAKG